MDKALHGVLAEYPLGGDEQRVGECFDRIRPNAAEPTTGLVRKVRYSKLGVGLGNLKDLLRDAEYFATLDLIGHGAPGQISCGDDGLLNAGSDLIGALARFRKQGAIRADSVIRLLGCSTGYHYVDPQPPLDSMGDGSVLAIAIQRAVGCAVQVTTAPIHPSDFGLDGFASDELLAQPDPSNFTALRLGPVPIRALRHGTDTQPGVAPQDR